MENTNNRKTLDKRDDRRYGANYVFIARDIMRRYDGSDEMRDEAGIVAEFCRDNIKVYRQLREITRDFKIHYLDSKLVEMRTAIKILDRLK